VKYEKIIDEQLDRVKIWVKLLEPLPDSRRKRDRAYQCLGALRIITALIPVGSKLEPKLNIVNNLLLGIVEKEMRL